MDALILIALDLVAITLLAGVLYFRRHRRRDLLVAFVGVNVGVLAVSVILADTAVSLGIGLGLFGVLSIIRLRSDEISQREIAYYFASLALGLIAGLSGAVSIVPIALMTLIVGALAVVDHPALVRRSEHRTVTLDAVYTDETELVQRLESLLGGRVRRFTVQHVDLVNDTCLVDVRFDRAPGGTSAARRELSGAELLAQGIQGGAR